MPGHFHIALSNNKSVNETSLPVALAKAQARIAAAVDRRQPVVCVEYIGFVCGFGCGMLHELTTFDCSVVRAAFPSLPDSAMAMRSMY
jgi:hypothetical protein